MLATPCKLLLKFGIISICVTLVLALRGSSLSLAVRAQESADLYLPALFGAEGPPGGAAPARYSLNFATDGLGIIVVTPHTPTYQADEAVTMTAIPAQGWLFSHWSGDLSHAESSAEVVMDADKWITAHFVSEDSDVPSGSVTPPTAPTPLPTPGGEAATPSPTAPGIEEGSATRTPQPPTSTSTSSPTLTPTVAPPIPTETAEPTPTATPTFTPTLTDTAAPPTSTPTSSATPTSVPPTATPILPLMAIDDSIVVPVGQTVAIDVMGNDTGGFGTRMIESITLPAHGVAVHDGLLVAYTPPLKFVGSDSFTYTIVDELGTQATASVAVTVVSGNLPPVTNDQSVQTEEETGVVVQLEARDPNDDPLTFSILTEPINGWLGTLREVEGFPNVAQVTYTPNQQFLGKDNFVFQADDGNGGVASGVISVTVVADATPFEGAEIRIATSVPAVDGLIDAVWDGVPRYSLEKVIRGVVPDSDGDLVANFRGLYDASRLYLLIDVTDENLRNDSGEEFWRDDVIELFVDGNLSQGATYDGVDDLQFFFRWDDPANYKGVDSIDVPPGIERVMINTATGYRLELSLPLADIGIQPTSGVEFGLDIHVSDDDNLGANGDDRETKLAWQSEVDETAVNPSLMGTARMINEVQE